MHKPLFGILAAGKGSRLEAQGYTVPKPLVPIGDTPMIGRLVDIFRRGDAERIVAVTNPSAPEVSRYLEEKALREGVAITIVEKDTPSAMHSLYEIASRERGEKRLIAATTDSVFLEEEFGKFLEAFDNLGNEYDGLMAVTEFIDDEKPLYVTVEGNGRITGFCDETPERVKYVSGGVYALGPKALEILEECVGNGERGLREFQRRLVERGLRLKAFPMGKIVDVDRPQDILTANTMIENERWQTFG